MNPIDEFELDVLDHSGDLELAENVGETARWAVATAVEALAATIGVPVEAIDVDALTHTMLGDGEAS